MPVLTTDEQRRVIVHSEPYGLRTAGRIAISGIEYVGPVDHRVADAEVKPGEYEAVVHLMDYDGIPDRDEQHPDFIVTLGPRSAAVVRTAVQSFRGQ